MKLVPCLAALATLSLALPAAAQTVAPPLRHAPAAAARQAVEASSPSVLALYLAGNAAAGEGRFDKATDYFARAASQATGEARNNLQEQAFQSALQSGDIARAAQLAPSFEGGSQGVKQLGQLVTGIDALASGDNTKAAGIFGGNTVGVQFRPLAGLLRPWAVAASGDKTLAAPGLPARADAVTRIVSTYNRALLSEVTGHDEGIDDAYKELLARGPDFLEIHYMYSYAAYLERHGRAADAVKIYDQILEDSPDNARAVEARKRAAARNPKAPAPLTAKQGAAQILVTQGMLSVASNDPETALWYFWMAVRLDSTRSDAMFLASSIEASMGATEAARGHFGNIPRTAPEYVDARISIAETWLAEHNTTEALKVARQTASRAPRDLSARVSLGSVLSIAGKNKEAVTAFTQVIRAEGEQASWNLYYARATAYNDLGDWTNTEQDLMKALLLSPDQPEVMNYLGYMWADRGEHLDQALVLLTKAARARPNQGAIIDSLGWVYYRMGDIPKAIENLERAAEMDAADPSVNDHLGDAYLSAGRKLEAVYQWQRVLTLQPDDKLKAQVQTKINTHQPATVASAAPAAPAAATP